MEEYIVITSLKEFDFCPKAVYLSRLFANYDDKYYKEEFQFAWQIAHETIDEKTYSTAKKYLQSLPVYSDRYKLCGKIDIYNTETKTLVERKNKVIKVYDGYKYQLYAQYRCMTEMGYDVQNLTIYSLKDNISYTIPLPTWQEQIKFEWLLKQYKEFHPQASGFTQNPKKCARCIYKELCDYYLSQKNTCWAWPTI